MRRILSACKKTRRKQDKFLVTSISSEHGHVFGMCFCNTKKKNDLVTDIRVEAEDHRNEAASHSEERQQFETW